MTTTTSGPTTADRAITARQVEPPQGGGLSWVIQDGLTVAKRNLIGLTRQPQLIVFSTIQPVMFVLLFNYVFGSALQIPGFEGNYSNFLLPGVFVQTVAFGATQTAIGLADDLQGGIIDRFRSLPMARSAVLIGRTLSDFLRNLFVVFLMVLVGYAVGFRFEAGIPSALGAVLIVTFFGFALSWVFAFVGLTVKGGAEAAQAASFVSIFPLVFASSAFVSTQTMPGWLQAFANNQPITQVVNAARTLVNGIDVVAPIVGETSTAVVLGKAGAWILGILVVFVPLAVRAYRRS
jgi:ABC-2 type transport system permease protein/oleandomycin transport system permease protein